MGCCEGLNKGVGLILDGGDNELSYLVFFPYEKSV